MTEAEVIAAGWTLEEIEKVGDIAGIHRAVGALRARIRDTVVVRRLPS